jgi:hypothetical protein
MNLNKQLEGVEVRKPILFVASVVAALLCGFIPARATAQTTNDVNITFQDLTDVLTVTGLPGGTFTCPLPPGAEFCQPPAFTLSGTVLGTYGPGGSGSFPTIALFAEPTTNGSTICFGGFLGPCISDGLATDFITTPGQVTFKFQSDPSTLTDPSLPGCIKAGGCLFTEDGTPQEVGQITTLNGTTITTYHVLVASEVEPEPATLILFGSGLVLVGGFLRRRNRHAVTASV